MRTVVIGGTSGIGLEVARHARGARRRGGADRPRPRPGGRGREVGRAVTSRGLALDLNDTHGLADALAGVGAVDRLVVAAIERDQNSIADYDVDRATKLAMLKLVGYTEVVHTLLPRMNDDSSVVLFGGRAKDRPYPGSITVSTVNGGVVGMVQRAGPGDGADPGQRAAPGHRRRQPVLVGQAGGVLDGYVSRTPTGRLATHGRHRGRASSSCWRTAASTPPTCYVDGGWLVDMTRMPAARRGRRHRPDGRRRWPAGCAAAGHP